MGAIANTTVRRSLRALLSCLIDYAGLFPPAGLGMYTAVSNYERYRQGEHAWMLGRFVLPVTRLDEFIAAQANAAVPDPWLLSALLGRNFASDFEAIDDFNRRGMGAVIDTVEMKASDAEEISAVQKSVPPQMTAYYEIPVAKTDELLPVLRQCGGRAKIRTGGTTPELIPTPEAVAQFISDCAREQVPFKATAGLHHALRGLRPLTYAPDAPTAKMHGFLNVFVAAAICWERNLGVPAHKLTFLLNAEGPDLRFEDDEIRIRLNDAAAEDIVLSTASLERMRKEFGIAFGSCSFEEPVEELRQLRLL